MALESAHIIAWFTAYHRMPYTASQRLLIRKAIDTVQQALKERRLDPLPVQYYDFYDINPEYGVDGTSQKPETTPASSPQNV